MEDFFRWLGEQVGTAIRMVVEAVASVFSGVDDFFTGLAESLGMSASIVNLIFLVLGLYLFYVGVRKLTRRAVVGGLVRIGFAVLLLGWLIH